MRHPLRLVPALATLALGGLLHAADTSHLVPAAAGVLVKPFASAGDAYSDGAAGTRTLAGLLDGLGAFDNGDGSFTLLASHEVSNAKGIPRAHNLALPAGSAGGAFVSRLKVKASDLTVQSLADLITTVQVFDYATSTWAASTTTVFNRFCSSDLPAETAVYNAATLKGVPAASARLFLNGEETTSGRAFLHLAKSGSALDGASIQLPHLGRMAFENIVLCPKAQDTTVAVCLDDISPGYVGIYVGSKAALPGAPTAQDVAAAAGLTGGKLYFVRANALAAEDRSTAVGAAEGAAAPFTLVQLGADGNAASTAFDTYAETTADIAAKGATLFLRPEDGAWDPLNPADFYFVTTDRTDDGKNGLSGVVQGNSGAGAAQTGRSRLWRLRFGDLANPAAGGTITLLIDGSENPGPQMMDNLAIDRNGRILIQEDPGNVEYAASVWCYTIASGALVKVAKFDPALFGDRGNGSPAADKGLVAASEPASKDEESSGIIDASDLLGPGWFLLTSQGHLSAAPSPAPSAEVVEYGQLLALHVPLPLGATPSRVLQTGKQALVGGTGSRGAVVVRDGGWGSSLAPVPGTTDQIYLLTDRGPNVDGATSSAKNFPVPAFQPRIGKFRLESDGTATLLATIGLATATGTPLTGLPLPAGLTGATGESGFAINADGSIGTTALIDANGIDSEGLVAHVDGTFWISDEYGPFIAHFAADGKSMERISPASAAPRKLPTVLLKRTPNRGMEGLTLTPDGTRLVGIMQSALMNPISESNAKKTAALRIVDITLATFATREYLYLLDDPATTKTAVSEITAISDTTFLVLERDGNAPGTGTVKRIYKIDLAGATDVHDPADSTTGLLYGGSTIEQVCGTGTTATATANLAAQGLVPVAKTLVADLNADTAAAYPHDKPEGIALVGSTLWVVNDDDFGVGSGAAAGSIAQKTVLGTAGASHGGVGLADFTQLIALDLSGKSVSAANRSPVLKLDGAEASTSRALVVGSTASVAVTGMDYETATSALTLAVTTVSGGSAAAAILSGSAGSWTLTLAGTAAGTAVFDLVLGDGTTTVTRRVTASVTLPDPSATIQSAANAQSAAANQAFAAGAAAAGDGKGCGLGSGSGLVLGGGLGLLALRLLRRRG